MLGGIPTSMKLLKLALALGVLAFSMWPSLKTIGTLQNAADSLPGFPFALSTDEVLAAEDGAPRIKQAKLSIWSEYDDPRVLVIYDGTFADTLGFPKQVQFRIPKDIEISQVCGISDKGDHLCQLYEIKQQDGDYNILTYTLPVPHFFFEYYYQPVGTDPVRNISHTFSTLQPIDKLDVEVQQPLRSTDFTMTPAAMSTGTDNDGFRYSQLSYDKVAQDQNIVFKISYSKQDNRPSVPKKQQNQTAGAGIGDSTNLNIWLLLGGAAIIGLAAYFVITRRTTRLIPQPAGYGGRFSGQANYAKPSTHSKQTGRAKGAAKVQGATGFCTGCGAPLAADDRFCSRCGKRSKGGS